MLLDDITFVVIGLVPNVVCVGGGSVEAGFHVVTSMAPALVASGERNDGGLWPQRLGFGDSKFGQLAVRRGDRQVLGVADGFSSLLKPAAHAPPRARDVTTFAELQTGADVEHGGGVGMIVQPLGKFGNLHDRRRRHRLTGARATSQRMSFDAAS